MHLLPLSCEGSATWGPGHGYLDSGGNPLTSPHGTDEADLHSAIKTNLTEPMCHHLQQHTGCKQHSNDVSHSTRSATIPTHRTCVEELLAAHLRTQQCRPSLQRHLAERSTDPLSSIWQICTQHRRAATNQPCGRWVSNTNTHTDLWYSWHSSGKVTPWQAAVKSHIYAAGCSVCI